MPIDVKHIKHNANEQKWQRHIYGHKHPMPWRFPIGIYDAVFKIIGVIEIGADY